MGILPFNHRLMTGGIRTVSRRWQTKERGCFGRISIESPWLSLITKQIKASVTDLDHRFGHAESLW